MGITVFAAINIGSYELTMKIYELTGRKKPKQLDFVSCRLDLGKDTYAGGKIDFSKLNELCEQLIKFKDIMEGYRTDACRVCATSAIRETFSPELVVEQIKTKTGLDVEVLSNSEQRFLQYKALAVREDYFDKMIHKKTAVADIGGGSLQMSLFDKDRLITTQNMRLGAVRIKERLVESSYRSTKYISMIQELIENDLEAFDRIYMDSGIHHMILLGEVATRLIQAASGGKTLISGKQYGDFYEKMISRTPEQIGRETGILADYSQMIYPVMVLIKSIVKRTGTQEVWAPGISLCDGMAYDYAVSHKMFSPVHNFEEDIVAAADNISGRFMCCRKHTACVKDYALAIFDATKKQHGLGRRERLLLEIIAMLHDCGKYISLAHAPKSSYNIIMSTEIIGLSHLEREIVANSVYYNTMPLDGCGDLQQKIGQKAYLTVCKLCAILRIANVLDRSHRQKIQKMRVSCRNGELVINVDTADDFSLEQQMFGEKAAFFEEISGIRAVLSIKNSL